MNERLPFLQDKTSKLTDSPGVYLMKDKSEKIIYIGKAKNLKKRVTSYFRNNPDHTPKVAKMVSKVYNYDFIVTDSEYEALLLECSLIKQYMPQYNILLKDDKGYHYIKISDGEYPRITAEMQKTDDGTYLGPYTSSFTTKQTVDEVNQVFLLPTCKRKFPQEIKKDRPCLNYHIKKCMGVCIGNYSKEEYQNIVNQAVDYIKTGSSESIVRIKKEMEDAAENLDFELAVRLRDRISAIKKAADTQKIVTDIKDTDIIAIATNNSISCASVLIYRNGRLYDKNIFPLGENDNDMLESFITQYYETKEDIPKEILLETEIDNTDIILKLLRDKCGHAVNISVPKIGNGLKLIMLAKNNASEYLSFKVGRTGKEIVALEELGKILGLVNPPKYIESYDISNLGSDSMVAGMVVFENGRPLKSAYRKFSIKENIVQNDVACMREVLERRFKHYQDEKGAEGFGRLPDLILLDGGKGQVNAVEPLLREMGIEVPVFGMVKDNKHRTRAITTGGNEITINDAKSVFNLVTNIQDEVHRFSITFQRTKHRKKAYSMDITQVNGIGEKKAVKLYSYFKTKEELRKASPEKLKEIAGVSYKIAEELYNFLQKTN